MIHFQKKTDTLALAVMLGALLHWSTSDAHAESFTLSGNLTTEVCSLIEGPGGGETCESSTPTLGPIKLELQPVFGDGTQRGGVKTTTTVGGQVFFGVVEVTKGPQGLFLHLAVGNNDAPDDAATADIGPLPSLDALSRLNLHGPKSNNGGTRLQPVLTIGK